MSLRYLIAYVCAAVAALFLSYNAAGAMVRPDPGLAPLAQAATVNAVGGAAIVKLARFGDRGGRVGGPSGRSFSGPSRSFRGPSPSFRSFRGPSPSFRSFRGPSRSFRSFGSFQRQFRGPGHVYRGFRSGRRHGRHFRGRRYSAPILPYVYGYYFPDEFYYGSCSYRHRYCGTRWGFYTYNYYACMRYYGCL
jgi:hypothetical protein